MTILETRTALSPDEVLRRARTFYETGGTPHAAFVEQVGDGYLRFRMEVGEVVIATAAVESGTIVRGCTSRGVAALSRLFSLLGAPMDVQQTTARHGLRREVGATVDAAPEGAPAPAGDGAEQRAA